MKMLSWNVNGIRAAVRKGFADFLKKTDADIICLQEVKIDEKARSKHEFDFKGWLEFWNCAARPGYSGTAILIKEKSFKKNFKIENCLPWDDEGRIQAIDLGKIYLVNIYFPNANHELSRLDFKLEFNKKILSYLKKLELKKPVVVCGDFNVAHKEMDIARPKDNEHNAGFTKEERAWMTQFLANGFVDTFRNLHENKIQYSWWSQRFNARARNIGWRIDYFCVSKKLTNKIKKSFIMEEVQGSDHAPVGIEIKN